MAVAPRDWAAVMERLLEGDRLALLEVSRVVTGFLRRWNAWDFRDDWDDLIQEVVLATARAMQEGRLRERGAVIGYLKSTARFKFADRLRRHLRCREDDELPWDEYVTADVAPAGDAAPGDPDRLELGAALEQLDPRKRQAVLAVYAEGWTYEEAAELLGVPLGTLKRQLKEGLAELKRRLRPQARRTRSRRLSRA